MVHESRARDWWPFAPIYPPTRKGGTLIIAIAPPETAPQPHLPAESTSAPQAPEDITMDDAEMEEGEIDESTAGVPGGTNEDVTGTGEDNQSMTDDSMSVSSGELPDTSELPTDAAATPSDAFPHPSHPRPVPPDRIADDLVPQLQGREPVGRAPIPLAPSRYYDPRERRVLGLADGTDKGDNIKTAAGTDRSREVVWLPFPPNPL
jgi:hypothetical protein